MITLVLASVGGIFSSWHIVRVAASKKKKKKKKRNKTI